MPGVCTCTELRAEFDELKTKCEALIVKLRTALVELRQLDDALLKLEVWLKDAEAVET